MYACLLWRSREELYPRLKDPDASAWQLFIRHSSWLEDHKKDDDEEEEEGGETHPLEFLASPYEGHVFWSVGSGDALASKLVH